MSAQVFSSENGSVSLQGRPHAKRSADLWALVPVKSLNVAKQRLKNRLGADRGGLALAMLKDVLAALCRSNEVSHIVLVTADPRVAAIAEQDGAIVVEEEGSNGMIKALERGLDAIRQMGGRHTAIIPADVPLISGPETDKVVRELRLQRKVRGDELTGIGPSKDLGGTNFLCIDANRPLPLMFGPDSYRRHQDCAIEHGYPPVSLLSDTISLDIDEEKDLDEFISFCLLKPDCQKTHTWQFLQEKGYVRNTG